MISVLICSANPEFLKNVQENIRDSIGIPFEILHFDNRVENYGICKVYNDLAAKAKFPYICFLHEDVIIKTENWGKKIIEKFSEDAKIGLVGIAGSKYKSAYFSGWYSRVKELDCANYFHQYPTGSEHVFLSPTDKKLSEEVVCIDGVMMCCKREVWKQTKFDEKMLKGFHFYDIDFSLRVSHQFKVMVTYDIDLIHITTGGDYSNNWIETAILFHEEKKDKLPFSKINLNRGEIDKRIIITTMDHLKNYKISFRNKKRWIVLQKLYLNPLFYYPILKFMLYHPLGLKKIHFKSKK